MFYCSVLLATVQTNTVKNSRRVSTYAIDYQGLNSSVIITAYIVVVVKFIREIVDNNNLWANCD